MVRLSYFSKGLEMLVMVSGHCQEAPQAHVADWPGWDEPLTVTGRTAWSHSCTVCSVVGALHVPETDGRVWEHQAPSESPAERVWPPLSPERVQKTTLAMPLGATAPSLRHSSFSSGRPHCLPLASNEASK